MTQPILLWPGGIGTGELVVLLIIILIIFGAGKLPQIGEALGKGIKNFKGAISNKDEDKSGEMPPGDEAAKPIENPAIKQESKK